MIGQSRSRAILILFALGTFFVLLRMFEIQVGEHRFWALEAARLVHSGREIPYRRGELKDARGQVLARDKDTHHLVLVYRDFRRGHPLGQVAHGRSVLAGRPVALRDTQANLYAWAAELVGLRPVELGAFADGEALVLSSLSVPPSADARAENRRRRALDASFYAKRLLPLSTRQLRALEKLAREKEGKGLSYVELASRVLSASEGPTAPDEVWAAVRDRIGRAMEQLDRLAARIEWPEPPVGDVIRDPESRLVFELEQSRRWVENATASKLFAEAAGFAPGRVDPVTLLNTIDVSWMTRLLAWDGARLAEWASTAREGWLREWRDGYALPRLSWQLVLDRTTPAGPDELLSSLMAVFRPRGSVEAAIDGELLNWGAESELAIFDELAGLFRAGLPPAGLPAEILPVQREEFRLTRSRLSAGDWRVFDAAWRWAPEEPLGATVHGKLHRGYASDIEDVRTIAGQLADDWDGELQRELLLLLESLQERAAPDELAPSGALLLSEGHTDRAAERADFFLKDYGTRPKRLVPGEPTYEIIYLIARYQEDFAGFAVREAREREYPVAAGDPLPPARGLVGSTTLVGVHDLLRQRESAQTLRELKGRPRRTEQEENELKRLIGEVRLHDEVKGVAGVEGFFNPELIGTNGYRESRGLEDVFGEGGDISIVREPVDGRDVWLTLDTALQRAAREELQRPRMTEDPEQDERWRQHPVGAAVLLSVDGDVLAAYSEPSDPATIAPGAPYQRTILMERTLRIPTFQPPGSVFKPFLAAYALDRQVRIDPENIIPCQPLDDGWSGYVDVHCWRRWGHGDVQLDMALKHSCNSYFAWIGETLTDADLRRAGEIFGFGRATGIATAPYWDDGQVHRTGLKEDVGGFRANKLGDHDRRLAGNGLGVIEATPMQLARAILALATGELKDLRLVQRIGADELPPGASTRLPLEEASLRRVRAALKTVTHEEGGTGYKALNPDELGYSVAAKTGSADYTAKANAAGKVRKHTWVAGWAPADDPQLIFVVFVHDTTATSSHGAVYLVRELLRRPELLGYLAEHGVEDMGEVKAR